MRTQSFTRALYLALLRWEIAMSNIDKPDEVAFAKAIAQNIPGQKESDKLWLGLVAIGIARKVLNNVNRK